MVAENYSQKCSLVRVSTSQTKIVQSYGYFDNAGKETYNQTTQLFTDTAAITELKFFCPTTTMAGGTVLVYGVK